MQASGMEKKLPSEEITRISHKQQAKTVRQSRKPTQPNSKASRQHGLTWPHNANSCPAKGQVYCKCGKPNLFAKMCLTKAPAQQQSHRPQQKKPQQSANQVHLAPAEPNSSSDDEYLYVMSQDSSMSKIPTVSVKIKNQHDHKIQALQLTF